MVEVTSPASPAPSHISPESYRYLQDYVYRESGIVIDKDKHYLLEARLVPLVTRNGFASINDLCDRLRANSNLSLRVQVVDAITTNETLFFREMTQYEVLRTILLPRLVAERQVSRTLRFWSAAASSGQEAYSLAMMLLEMGLANWHIDILATDISTHILERAKAGRFLQIEVNRGLPVNYLVKYFTQHGVEWELKPEVRRMVRFMRFDLRNGMAGLGPFDFIFCRNVLIYFDDATKKQILRGLRGALDRNGLLFLGGAEAILQLDAQFAREIVGGAVLYKPLSA